MTCSKYESHYQNDLKRSSLSKTLKEDIFSNYSDSTETRSIVFQSFARPKQTFSLLQGLFLSLIHFREYIFQEMFKGSCSNFISYMLGQFERIKSSPAWGIEAKFGDGV